MTVPSGLQGSVAYGTEGICLPGSLCSPGERPNPVSFVVATILGLIDALGIPLGSTF